jgi:pimeloyl-ACP methyl ester carboxylesterase
VTVPVDRTGEVPGTISLHVEALPAEGEEKGVLFLLAGGPGSPGTEVFPLGLSAAAVFFRALAPGYTLVTYDIRGTGRSGRLHCTGGYETIAKAVTACARSLGARRDFYGTGEHAEDLESVRAALGYPSISLYGVSYGTRLALAYALAHRGRVERLVLDSPVLPRKQDPFLTNVLTHFDERLSRLCARGRCRAATPDFADDVIEVARGLLDEPLRGAVRQPSGRPRDVELDLWGLFSLARDVDEKPGLAAALPAATRAARLGDPRPLLRVFDLVYGQDRPPSAPPSQPAANASLYLATTCRDGGFPWKPETPLGRRTSFVLDAMQALPLQAMGPFVALLPRLAPVYACVGWPTPARGRAIADGPFPDVPVLALGGELDWQTPIEGARELVSRFRNARLLVVSGSGHGVVKQSYCARDAVATWIAGRGAPRRCGSDGTFVAAVAAYGEATEGGGVAGPQRTFAVAANTIREAGIAGLLGARESRRTVAGPESGTVTLTRTGKLNLVRYGIQPGVWVSGTLSLFGLAPPTFSGRIVVGGTRASAGNLVVDENRVSGMLGGVPVG